MMKTLTYNRKTTVKKVITTLTLLITLGLSPGEAFAARIFSTGFEWQSVTANVEFDTVYGSPAISTSIKNGGSASLLLNGAANNSSEGFKHNANQTVNYKRAYVYVDALAVNAYVQFGECSANPCTTLASIKDSVKIYDSSGSLKLDYVNNSGTTVISNVSLSYDTWHRIEIYNDRGTGADGVITVRVNGVQVGNATAQPLTAASSIAGSLINLTGGTDSTSNVYMDDVAFNDTSGSAQTSWPGLGKIVAAVPNAAGFTGTACQNAGAVFSAINEIPPSDAVTGTTDRCDITTNAGFTVTHNVTDSSTLGIDSYDTISLVYTMHRMREVTNGATNWAPLLSANGSATTTGTSLDTGDATTVRTNPNGTTAFGNGIVSYTNPATSLAWTPTGTNSIDSMKLGFTSTDANPDITNATAAAMIEYVDVPLAPIYLGSGKLILTNGKMLIY